MTENVKDMQLPVELTDLLGDLEARILQTQIKLSGTIGMDEWHKYQFAVFCLIVAKMEIDQEKLDYMTDMFAAHGLAHQPSDKAQRLLDGLSELPKHQVH
jgi:hypothetical protein